MMQPLLYFACTCLCILSFLCPVLSIQCNKTEYAWPLDNPKYCCNKCPPGKHLVQRNGECHTQCEPCIGEQYTETYNLEFSCRFCENCNRPNMEYKSLCNATHNAVCRCKVGYVCKEQPCKECVPIPSTTSKPTLLPFTTALKLGTLTTLWTPAKPLRDTVWFLVIIAFLSAGITFLVLTRIKPFLRWIISKHGYFLPETHAPVPPCSEDEEVSKPVQEAGNVTNLKIDPELGLANISRVDL